MPLEEEDVRSIIVGSRLHTAVVDLHAIRVHLLDEEDDGEAEEGDY